MLSFFASFFFQVFEIIYSFKKQNKKKKINSTIKRFKQRVESRCFCMRCQIFKKKIYSGAHSRVATLIQPSFQKNKKNSKYKVELYGNYTVFLSSNFFFQKKKKGYFLLFFRSATVCYVDAQFSLKSRMWPTWCSFSTKKRAKKKKLTLCTKRACLSDMVTTTKKTYFSFSTSTSPPHNTTHHRYFSIYFFGLPGFFFPSFFYSLFLYTTSILSPLLSPTRGSLVSRFVLFQFLNLLLQTFSFQPTFFIRCLKTLRGFYLHLSFC